MDVDYSSALATGEAPAAGEVWLVGAGPGDPGLLTQRAATALARADLVLHDALPGRAMLRLVRAGALGLETLREVAEVTEVADEGRPA